MGIFPLGGFGTDLDENSVIETSAVPIGKYSGVRTDVYDSEHKNIMFSNLSSSGIPGLTDFRIELHMPKSSDRELVESILSNFIFLKQADTSNWKTYRNEQYGFEFQYPTNFIRQEEEYGYTAFDSTKGSIAISIDKEKFDPNNFIGPQGDPIFLEQVSIGDRIGYKTITGDGGCGVEGYLIKIEENTLHIGFSTCFDENPDPGPLSLFDDKSLINSILSTFKFIN